MGVEVAVTLAASPSSCLDEHLPNFCITLHCNVCVPCRHARLVDMCVCALQACMIDCCVYAPCRHASLVAVRACPAGMQVLGAVCVYALQACKVGCHVCKCPAGMQSWLLCVRALQACKVSGKSIRLLPALPRLKVPSNPFCSGHHLLLTAETQACCPAGRQGAWTRLPCWRSSPSFFAS